MVEKIVAQAPFHRKGQVVAIAGLFRVQVHLRQLQDLVPVLPIRFCIQPYYPLVWEIGHAPGFAVYLMDRRPEGPDPEADQQGGRDRLEPGVLELQRQQDQGKERQRGHRIASQVKIPRFPQE